MSSTPQRMLKFNLGLIVLYLTSAGEATILLSNKPIATPRKKGGGEKIPDQQQLPPWDICVN